MGAEPVDFVPTAGVVEEDEEEPTAPIVPPLLLLPPIGAPRAKP